MEEDVADVYSTNRYPKARERVRADVLSTYIEDGLKHRHIMEWKQNFQHTDASVYITLIRRQITFQDIDDCKQPHLRQ
jgi:hypothetical protein